MVERNIFLFSIIFILIPSVCYKSKKEFWDSKLYQSSLTVNCSSLGLCDGTTNTVNMREHLIFKILW